MLRVTAGAVSVTMAMAFFVVSACETALTETVVVVGNTAGAVYSPVELIVPLIASPPAAPFTCHVTVILVDPVTVAVNCCVVAPATLAVVGEMATETPVVVELFLPPHPDQISAVATTKVKSRFGKGFDYPY